MNDPNLLYVPLKLLLYWGAIVLVLHVLPKKAGRALGPPMKVAAWVALARFGLGLLFGLPLGILSVQLPEVVITIVFGVARFAAWIISLRPYRRLYALRAAVFACGMTGLNFVMDYFVLGDWIASGLANFHMC